LPLFVGKGVDFLGEGVTSLGGNERYYMSKEPVHPLDRKPKATSRGKSPARSKAGSGPKRKRMSGAGGAPKRKRTGVRRRPASHTGPPAGTVRIQKLLAEAGLASRRACEDMVAERRVRVNGKLVRTLPCFVTPGIDKVQVDGMTIRPKTIEKVYVLVNKPKGVVCTNSDREGRPRVIDLVRGVAQRVFPVGRLDAESTGLILLTNDGDLANHISHPRYGLAKTYVVEVEGHMDGTAIDKMKAPMYLDGKRTGGASVKVLRRSKVRTLLEVRLTEGRNREIRRVLARLKYKAHSLRRTAIGTITDRGVKTGNYRLLSDAEVKALRRQTQARRAKG